MPYFRYTAKDKTGKASSALIEAPDVISLDTPLGKIRLALKSATSHGFGVPVAP